MARKRLTSRVAELDRHQVGFRSSEAPHRPAETIDGKLSAGRSSTVVIECLLAFVRLRWKAEASRTDHPITVAVRGGDGYDRCNNGSACRLLFAVGIALETFALRSRDEPVPDKADFEAGNRFFRYAT